MEVHSTEASLNWKVSVYQYTQKGDWQGWLVYEKRFIVSLLPVFTLNACQEIATTCLSPCKVVYMSLKPLHSIADELTDFIYLLLASKEEIEKEQGEDSTTLLKKEHYLAILTDLFFGRSIRHATTVFF